MPKASVCTAFERERLIWHEHDSTAKAIQLIACISQWLGGLQQSFTRHAGRALDYHERISSAALLRDALLPDLPMLSALDGTGGSIGPVSRLRISLDLA